MRSFLIFNLTLLGLLRTADVQAHSPYAPRPALDIPVTLALLGGSAAMELTAPETARLECHPCASTSLNWLDRSVVGPRNRDVDLGTDLLVGLAIASPFALSGYEEWRGYGDRSIQGWLTDGLVISESLAVSLMLMQLTKRLLPRPRPFTYARPPSASAEVALDATRSFYSGHTAMAFAGVVAGVQSQWRRGRRGGSLAVSASIGLALAAGVGVGRVVAARHFWTDVMAGAVIGSLAGWMVPWIHVRQDAGPVEPGDAVSWRLSPLGIRATF